jgi:glycosyltransferase involved in cell wall biosynthesis
MQAEPEKFSAERSPFGWRREENGVQAIYLPTWFRYRAMSWNPAVKRYCRARLQNFDIVHIFGLYDLLGPVVASACRKRGIPYVVEPIGMFVPIVRNLLLKRMYHSFMGRRLFQGASAVIATSDQEVEELAGGGIQPGKIVLRRNGVEPPSAWPEPGTFRRTQGVLPQEKLVLFLGRLSSKKSPDLLLRALAELSSRTEGTILKAVFAGPDEGGMLAHLGQLARQLGLSEQVTFAGPIFGQEKWAAYRDADVFVLPSQNENFGNTAAEAVAAGTPVVVTEQCGIAPLLADEAGITVPHDASALASALYNFFKQPGLRQRLIDGCAAVTARLGWDEPVRQMESLYAAIASNPGLHSPAMRGA